MSPASPTASRLPSGFSANSNASTKSTIPIPSTRLPNPSAPRQTPRKSFGKSGNQCSLVTQTPSKPTGIRIPTLRTPNGKANKNVKQSIVPPTALIDVENTCPDLVSSVQATPRRVGHSRRTSIPKSPKAVFRPVSLNRDYVFPPIADRIVPHPSADPAGGTVDETVQSTLAERASATLLPMTRPGQLPTAATATSFRVPNNPLPSLLSATPSFLMAQHLNPVAPTLRKFGIRGRPAAARPSLLLATPSFTALRTSDTNATLLSLPVKPRSRSSDVPNASSKPQFDVFSANSDASTRPAVSDNLSYVESHKREQGAADHAVFEDVHVLGLPNDMLETVDELESLARAVRLMPIPEAPSPKSAATTSNASGHDQGADEAANKVEVSGPQGESILAKSLVQSPSSCSSETPSLKPERQGVQSAPPARGKHNYSFPFRPVPMPAASAQTPRIDLLTGPSPAAGSKLPRLRRLSFGRAVSDIPTSAQNKSRIPSLPQKSVKEHAQSTSTPSKPQSMTSATPLSAATSTTSTSRLRSALRPRQSEPLVPSTMKATLRSAPASKIAKRARHSEVPAPSRMV